MRADDVRPRSDFAHALRLFRANGVRFAWFHALAWTWRNR